MNAYGSGWGSGYVTPPQSYVSTDPGYDPYANSFSNSYVSTDPNYDPYADSGGGLNMGGMWGQVGGALASGIAGYAQANANADAMKQQAQLSAKAQKELLEQQRQYSLQDRAYKQGATSNWSKYFG